MSSKALTDRSFEPAVEQTTVAADPRPETLSAEGQFREDLWREYRLEAIKAGFSAAEAAEYANGLLPEVGSVVGVPATAPAGRGWFYQSRSSVAKRSFNSGLITVRRWQKSKTVGRTAAALVFAPGFRPWNAGGKS
jgi:hypothetical protein